MKRLQFVRAALERGWLRLGRPAENVSLFVAFMATFGLPTTIGFFRDSGALGLALGLVASCVVLLFEGAFQLWREARHDDEQAAGLRAACEGWRGEVTHLLEVRDAARPAIEEDSVSAREAVARRIAGQAPLPPPPRDEEGRKKAAAYDRETVSLYLERYASFGVQLFDELVRRESLAGHGADREKVRSPSTRGQIDGALLLIQMGEWGDLRWRRS